MGRGFYPCVGGGFGQVYYGVRLLSGLLGINVVLGVWVCVYV